MLESGVPVVNGYIADVHGNEHIPGLTACNGAPSALGPGTPCYIAQAQYYNTAFGTFFQRLAADGINASNTEFVLSSDEGDHVAGANVGRAIQPTPANCDGVTVACTYPAGTFGELGGNITGLLATQKNNTTPFSLESDSAPEFYVTGNPGPNAPVVRKLERDVAGLTANNPYAGVSNQLITNYIADPAEDGDPAHGQRRPGPDADVRAVRQAGLLPVSPGVRPTCCPPCVAVNSGFAYNHGDYAAEINTNYLGLAGPGVKNLGLDGQAPTRRTELRRAEQRPGGRGQQRHHGHLGRRDRHPADPDVPDRAEGRLRARRPGHHRGPRRPEHRAQRARRDQPGGLLQAAQLQRRPVRQLHPAGLDGRRRVQHHRRRRVQDGQRRADRAQPGCGTGSRCASRASSTRPRSGTSRSSARKARRSPARRSSPPRGCWRSTSNPVTGLRGRAAVRRTASGRRHGHRTGWRTMDRWNPRCPRG